MSRRAELIFNDFFGKSLFDKPILADFDFGDLVPSMRMDIKENENNYTVLVDIPGIPKENVTIDVEEGYLTIATKVEKETTQDGVWLRRERYHSSQTQKIYVGDIKEEDIKASIKDGVLTITIPKVEEKKPEKKYINIE